MNLLDARHLDLRVIAQHGVEGCCPALLYASYEKIDSSMRQSPALSASPRARALRI